MTSKQNQLTDSAYIQWMDKENWSLTEAIYLLHGQVPLESTVTNKYLLKEFPDAAEMLQHYSKPNQEDSTECPEDWVFRAMNHDMGVTNCWKAIFIQMITDNFHFHNGKPDYHRFIQVFQINYIKATIEGKRREGM